MEPRERNDLHDWEIVSVLSEPLEQRLTMSLAFPSAAEAVERADLVFEGALGHYLEGELHQNVILEVLELAIPGVVRKYGFLFQRERSYSWPGGIHARDDADLIRELEARGVRSFEILSAIGMAGFVLARSADVRGVRASA